MARLAAAAARPLAGTTPPAAGIWLRAAELPLSCGSSTRAGFAVVAELPAPGFRFGQHSTDRGLMPDVILFGAIGGKGVAYRLTPAGQYSKVVETPGVVGEEVHPAHLLSYFYV